MTTSSQIERSTILDRAAPTVLFQHGGLQLLGAGRSGRVYLRSTTSGPAAQKIFGARGVTKLVQIALLGAPNPYAWDADAIECAHLRREILAYLVHHWFHGRLRVARSLGTSWDTTHAAFSLHTEFVQGRHAKLERADGTGSDDVRSLYRLLHTLHPLLKESGLDGMLWQSAYGQPVGMANFMRENHGTWVWIDLESGIPAIVPLSPVALLRFYLPACMKHRRLLFDDIDTTKLRGYLEREQESLEQSIGERGLQRLLQWTHKLCEHQNQWRVSRLELSLKHAVATQKISVTDADFYRSHRSKWILRQFAHAGRELSHIVRSFPQRAWSLLATVRPLTILANVSVLLLSRQRRERFARTWLAGRITEWTRRSQLNDAECTSLLRELNEDDVGENLSHLGMHMALKPATKVIQASLLPALYLAGVLSLPVFLALLAVGGALPRSLYTVWVCLCRFRQGRTLPVLALMVGLIPVVGALAFAIELLRDARRSNESIAQFLAYDRAAALGRAVPIWGGEGSLLEHSASRLPNLIFRKR